MGTRKHGLDVRPLRPTSPAELEGMGRRLHDIALTDGRPDVAHMPTYVFGHATRPDRDTDFSVADRVSADRAITRGRPAE
ncbi:hypothetical protein [Streptomyces sp.]|uniref:hypothetical protein n=2 Tax=Streptomyces sp. TaxID=1931 RepID=UPI0028119AB4|nr:hypothetical protein [Streptomyces sp.]